MSVTKFLRIDFLWLLVKMVEEFLRISNPSQICTEELIKKKELHRRQGLDIL